MIQKTWAALEGTPTPLGVTWIPAEKSFNFAIYSKYGERVMVLLYRPDDFVHPIFTYEFEALKNKTGRIWHARISEGEMQGAAYYAYSIDGPYQSSNRFERHAFNPHKTLLDPYAKSIFFPPGFDRSAAFGRCSNAGKESVTNVWSAAGLQGKSLVEKTSLRKCIRPLCGEQFPWP